MSKGLEALERIGKQKYKTTVADITGFETVTVSVKQDNKKDYNIIEKELKEHEQYKAIEQELGIDLITLFKALKNGIYISKNDKRFIPTILCHADLTLELEIGYTDYVSVKDYGKTWALTKEELEK